MSDNKSTKDRLLNTLLQNPRSTILALAEAVGINAISVRHHLTNLLASGTVKAEEERHGVGRPRLVYSLTEHGLELFPSRYYRFTNRLLDHIKVTLPDNQVNAIFSNMADSLITAAKQKVPTLSFTQRISLLKDILEKEGFLIDLEKTPGEILIHERACPYFHIGQQHPEICSLDQTVISTILSIPAEKIRCVLNGDAHCTFVVPVSNEEVS